MRGGLAALVVSVAAMIAAGCGGSGSGSGGAAKNAPALDFIPKSALGYVTIDTDFSGDQWSQFSDLAKAFDKDFKGVEETLAEQAKSGEDAVDFAKDVDPWLGDSAGAALLRVKDGGDDADAFAWVELEDAAKFETFMKDRDAKAGKDIGDFKTFEGGDEGQYVAYDDDLALLANSRAQLTAIVEFDGDSIKDAEGVGDAIDEVEGDALATLVVSGAGVREFVKNTEQARSLTDLKQLKDFHAMAVSFSAEDDGLLLDGHVHSSGEDAGKNEENTVFEDVPANTVLAVGGNDLGGRLKRVLDDAGKGNAQLQQGIGAISGIVGVDLDGLTKAFDGQWVLGLSADEAGLGALVGGAAGAAMGGGTDSLDPAALLTAGSLFLAFEETGDARETVDKIVGAVGGLTGSAGAPKEGASGDFKTRSLTVQGLPITTASSDGVAAVSVGVDTFSAWGGDDSLGESDSFTSAWDAADAPDKSLGQVWLDAGRVANLAGVESGEGVKLGGLVGWFEADGSNGNFGMFLHVAES